MKGKIESLLAIAVIAGSSLNARAADAPERPGVSLDVIANTSEVFVLVVNRSSQSITISYPFPLTIGESRDGLEFLFNRVDENPATTGDRKLCAFIDGPLERSPAPITLHAGTTIGARFGLDELQALHCAENGVYEMRVKYYNSAAGAESEWRELHAKAKVKLEGQGRNSPGSASKRMPKTE